MDLEGASETSGPVSRHLSEVGPNGDPELPCDDPPGIESANPPAQKEWRPLQFHGRRSFELAAAAFFLFYTFLTIVDDIGPGFVRWLLPLVLGINSVHFLRRTLDPRPRLALEEGGIRDRTSIGSVELFIPWEEVEGVQISPGRGTVEVRVRDPIRLRRTTGWVRRLWMTIGGLAGKKTISINPGFLGLKKPELTDLIEDAQIAFERAKFGFGPKGNRALPEAADPDAREMAPEEGLA